MNVYTDSLTTPTGYCALPQGNYTLAINDGAAAIVAFIASVAAPAAGNVAARLTAIETKVGIVAVGS